MALDGVSLDVAAGERVALVGPNASGKTSLFNCVTGAYRPTSGDVVLDSRSLLGLAPDVVARRGVSRTFQDLRLFGRLTVLENLLVGRHRHWKTSLWAAALGGGHEEGRHRRRAEEILERLDLQAWRSRRAAECPFGVRKRVGLARALAGEPLLLLLDEPTSGLAAEEKDDLVRRLQGLERGTTVVISEHDPKVASRLAERVVTLRQGRRV